MLEPATTDCVVLAEIEPFGPAEGTMVWVCGANSAQMVWSLATSLKR